MSDANSPVDRLVAAVTPPPVLLDIGASAGTPHIWLPVARHAIYVGFDPDLREMREISDGAFLKASTLPEAVTAEPADQVTFYLTRAPQCSSTLWPNTDVLSNYLHAERFVVEREVRVKATTLNAVLDRLSLDRIDWLKIDTQGTDLRTYNSLRDEVRSRLLAVDVEPGLRGAYVGEDLFGDVHRDLLREGFWLSRGNVKGFPRVREKTVGAVLAGEAGLTEESVTKALPASPGWVECRYFRTIEWLTHRPFEKRDYVLLWAFTLTDGQLGFAADLAMAYEQRFGPDDNARAMLDESVRRIRSACHEHRKKMDRANSLVNRLRRKIARTLDPLTAGR